MGAGTVFDDGYGFGGSVSFGPGGVSGSVSGGAGTAAPCAAGTSCGAQQNNFALIVIAVAVVVLLLR